MSMNNFFLALDDHICPLSLNKSQQSANLSMPLVEFTMYKDDICSISHLNLLVHLFELLPSRVGHLLLLHSEE